MDNESNATLSALKTLKKENLWVYTPLYEKDTKQNKTKQMETTVCTTVEEGCVFL